MSYRTLPAKQAFWRRSNQMGVMNTDLAKQLEATTLGARLWQLQPGQASTRHRHRRTHEPYVLLHGTGRIRIGQTATRRYQIDRRKATAATSVVVATSSAR
jgi:uncharacterized cupin superfamily protein